VIQIKSVYEPARDEDGYRILIEPVWPSDLRKNSKASWEWMKGLGPSENLRGWMRRNPRKVDSFRDKYLAELGHNEKLVAKVAERVRTSGTVTLLYVPDEQWPMAETALQYLRAFCDVG
jgi:uncharacterized protein YeaO (DUF488 family)